MKNEPIDKLPKTSALTIKRLKSLNIFTFWDLLNYFPNRFENYSLISKIGSLQEGELVTVKGQIVDSKNVFTRRGLKIQKVVLADGTGKIEVTWFNQPFLIQIFKKGSFAAISGEVKKFLKTYTLEPRGYEILPSINAPCLHTARLVPIYSEKKNISSRVLRDKIAYVLDNLKKDPNKIDEFLPQEIITYNQLISENEAYFNIHFPDNVDLAEKSEKRLSFDEFFVIQLSARFVRAEWEKEKVQNKFNEDKKQLLEKFIVNLPFHLTNAQIKATNEILKDLTNNHPMNRFLQGEVGSGKTVVAAIAAYFAYLNGFQTIVMAPTEILATQHYQTITKLFKKYPLKVGIQTGSKKISKKKNELIEHDIIIGTHAIYNQSISFKNVGLVVIDEQHRFGVVQRARLKKKGINPHLLTMTATPIPRTVTLTLYGELDLSVIDEMPVGRIPIKTYLVQKNKRESAYEWIKKEIKKEGIQVFIICPLIEESKVETMKSIKAAKHEFEFLKNNVFQDFKLGLLHGKLKTQEKDLVMKDFKDRKYDILVATSVVEVGIDIPNANIIVIEASERYGMSQLHQLRGRVGRGSKQSYCLIFSESESIDTQKKLKFFTENNDGMKLAEYDLKLRGPGQIFGTRQHGFSNLKIASFHDYNLIKQVKSAINYFMNKYELDKFEDLKKRVNEYQVQLISRD